MTEQTLELLLPVDSYEAAIPYLRRPYMPNQVRAKIQTAPENENAPCTIALYAIAETLMDRFTLICGREWDHSFEKTVEEKRSSTKASWYCMVVATITVFGKTHADIGEGTAPTRAGAEMNARAQAYKRAGRKFGPGQCLYACDDIVMWRGGDGENKLRLPANGAERHLHPYFDDAGVGQRYVRRRYEQWLKDSGEAVFGEPLDHLALAHALERRARTTVVAVTSRQPQPTLPPGTGNGANNGRSPEQPTTPAQAQTSLPTAGARAVNRELGKMEDHPAPPAAIYAATSAGYGEQAARQLCNLARADAQGRRFTKAQLRTVENWLSYASKLELTEEVLLDAVTFNAEKPATQERRQALFMRWLARKAAGESTPEEEDVSAADGQDAAEVQAPPTAEAPQAAPKDQAHTGMPSPQERYTEAMAELKRKMADHEYDDAPVTRLAALATGRGPRSQVDWQSITAPMLLALADLLDSAASLGWDSQQLDRELLKAHDSDRQTSAAGRFSAFANGLKDMAETRALEVG